MVFDGREGGMETLRETAEIRRWCARYRTDGLMILELKEGFDFSMDFFNPDGTGGMMCGNGGRCITAFAAYLGIRPADGKRYHFLAPDGVHYSELLESPAADGPLCWQVRLKMIDVQAIRPSKDGWFLNTGTRHLVRFVDRVAERDMEAEAKPLRWDAEYRPEGTNVNLVEVLPDGLHVRTYEKGVEGETLACGTGITASALAAWHAGLAPYSQAEGRVKYRLQCRRGDWLAVDFLPVGTQAFRDVYLTGPAELTDIVAL